MSERWKYQLKVGLPWGIFMSVVMIFFGVNDRPFTEQIQSQFFYIQTVGFLLFGVFVLGYSSWKSKIRREGKK
jgi:hypothetical protein